MDNINLLAKGFIIVAAGVILSKFFNLVYRILFAKYLGAAGYGFLVLGIGVISVTASLMLLGLEYTISRFVAYYKSKDHRKILPILKIAGIYIIIVSFLLILFFGIFYNYISFYVKSEIFMNILKYFVITIPFFTLIILIQKAFEGSQYIKYSTAISVVSDFLKVFLLTISVALGLGFLGAVRAFLAAVIFSFLFAVVLLNRKLFRFRDILRSKFNLDTFKEVFFYTWPISIALMLHSIMTWADSFILAYFSGAKDVGIYHMAYSIAGVLGVFVIASNAVFMPITSNVFGKNKIGELKRLYATSVRWIMLVSMPILFLILVYPREILTFIAGEEFGAGYIVLMIAGIGVFITTAFIAANSMLLSVNKTKYILLNSATSLIISIILNIILIPKYNILGAAITYILVSLVITTLRVSQIAHSIKIHPFNRMLSKLILIFIISFTISYSILQFITVGLLVKLILSFAIFIAAYLILIAILRCYDDEDVKILNKIKSRILGSSSL